MSPVRQSVAAHSLRLGGRTPGARTFFCRPRRIHIRVAQGFCREPADLTAKTRRADDVLTRRQTVRTKPSSVIRRGIEDARRRDERPFTALLAPLLYGDQHVHGRLPFFIGHDADD